MSTRTSRLNPFNHTFACLALLAFGRSLCAAPVELSLADAVRRAHEHSPATRAAQARERDASAKVRGASSLPSTNLSLMHAWGGATGGMDEDILVSQLLELPFKVAPRVRAARADRDATRSLLLVTHYDVEFSVAAAYYEALAVDTERQLTAGAVDTAKAFAEAAQTQFEAGDAAKSNVLRAGVERARAEQALDAVSAKRESRYAVLRSLTGLPANAEVALTDPLAFTPLSFDPSVSVSNALKNRPDIRAARETLRAKQAGLSAVRLEPLPDLVLEERHSTINIHQGASSLRAGVSFPLLDLGRHRADAASARAVVDEAQANLEETIRLALLDVDASIRAVDVARRAVESFKSGRLAHAKELLDMAQTGYEHGATSYLELLDARQVYRLEQADFSGALADYNIAVASLRRSLGGNLP